MAERTGVGIPPPPPSLRTLVEAAGPANTGMAGVALRFAGAGFGFDSDFGALAAFHLLTIPNAMSYPSRGSECHALNLISNFLRCITALNCYGPPRARL